MMKQLIRKK